MLSKKRIDKTDMLDLLKVKLRKWIHSTNELLNKIDIFFTEIEEEIEINRVKEPN